MLNTAVCDDERTITEQIQRLIKKYLPDTYTDVFTSGEQLLSAEKRFDIIFLDVQMNGINGIETARRLRSGGCRAVIIFISAIKEYVFSAFDVEAFHYLLKPIDEKKFCNVIERAAEEARKKAVKKKQLFIKLKGKSFTAYLDDIYYLESQIRKIAVCTKDDTISFYGTISGIIGKLDERFFRCHRSYIVNMQHITTYTGDSITLENGAEVYMAKNKYQEFVKSYMHFLKGGETCYV